MHDDNANDNGHLGLTVSTGPAAGASSVFGGQTVLVGRSNDCSFQIDDPTVSRLHFSISPVRGRWELTDAGSSSGTVVNGELKGDVGSICVLHDGDIIRAGQTEIIVTIEDERNDSSLDDGIGIGNEFPIATNVTARTARPGVKDRIRKLFRLD